MRSEYNLPILILADSGKKNNHGQLSHASGLPLGNLESNSVFQVLSWSSHKSDQPIKSMTSTNALAAGKTVDEGK